MNLPKINLPPIQTKYKIMALIGVIGLLLGFYFDHVYKPHTEKIDELKEGLAGLQDMINVIRNVEYPNIKTDQEIMKKIELKKREETNKINQLEAQLPKKTEYSKMLEKITHIAYKSGFDIKTLEPKNFTTIEGYNIMTLEMVSSSKFLNLLSFLDKLSAYQLKLENINVDIRERPNLIIRLNLSILAK